MILWTVAYQALLFMEFSRQEYWGGFKEGTADSLWVVLYISKLTLDWKIELI